MDKRHQYFTYPLDGKRQHLRVKQLVLQDTQTQPTSNLLYSFEIESAWLPTLFKSSIDITSYKVVLQEMSTQTDPVTSPVSSH
jgi:hypothetical protein